LVEPQQVKEHEIARPPWLAKGESLEGLAKQISKAISDRIKVLSQCDQPAEPADR
jgi:hypothetical protein